MKIALDVDGVLLNLDERWMARLHAKYSTTRKYTAKDWKSWTFWPDIGLSQKEAFSVFDASIYFETQMMPDADKFVDGLRRQGHAVQFLTSCPNEEHASAKRNWLREHGMLKDGDEYIAVFPGTSKVDVSDAVILIDDGAHNGVEWMRNHKDTRAFVLYPQPHNRHALVEWQNLFTFAPEEKPFDFILRALNTMAVMKRMLSPLPAVLKHQELKTQPSPVSKHTNPKDVVATTRVPFWAVPTSFITGTAVALYEGALKYGRYNWRKAGVRASVYHTAVQGHLNDWWEGEDVDPDSGLSHLYKAAASLAVLIDAKENGMMTDDRPPASPKNVALRRAMFDTIAALQAKHKNAKPHQYTIADGPAGEV